VPKVESIAAPGVPAGRAPRPASAMIDFLLRP
jgi:hypothetical protein